MFAGVSHHALISKSRSGPRAWSARGRVNQLRPYPLLCARTSEGDPRPAVALLVGSTPYGPKNNHATGAAV